MSPLAAILACAALFAAFGLVQRERRHRSCGACAQDQQVEACSTCPLHEVRHD